MTGHYEVLFQCQKMNLMLLGTHQPARDTDKNLLINFGEITAQCLFWTGDGIQRRNFYLCQQKHFHIEQGNNTCIILAFEYLGNYS